MTIPDRIGQWTKIMDHGDIHLRVISPDNVTDILGSIETSRIYGTKFESTEASPRIFS